MPKRSQMYLTVDFIPKLPLVTEKDVILVVCNKLSKIFCDNYRKNINKRISKVVQK